jgi:hypothetical protein
METTSTKKWKYSVSLADREGTDGFTSLREAMKFAVACKDDHWGASVTEIETGECLALWTRGEDGKVRKVVVR